MPDIPLPKGLRGGARTPKQRETLRNCYASVADGITTIITRPVVKSAGTGIGICRGTGMFKDELYQVSNDRLIKITITDPLLPPENNLTVTDLGQISGSEPCHLVAGYTALCIIVEGGAGYVYTDAGVLSEITDPSFKPSILVTYDSGRFVFVPYNGDPFFWSLLQDPTNILAVNFADAEEFPDLNKAVAYRRKQIYVGGGRSFERIQYNASLDTYATINGATSSVGYIGGMVGYGETFLFIGTGVNGGFGIYGMSEIADPISNPAVDEILGEYTADDLNNCLAASFKWEGKEFALFYLPNHTLCFYGDWAIWHSGNDITINTWSVRYFQFCYGYIFTGDFESAAIGYITDGNEEYDEPIDAGFTTLIKAPARSNAIISKVTAYVNPGETANPASIGLSVSRDGVIFGPMINKGLGKKGDYAREITWGSPVIKINDFAALRVSWRGDMQLTCDGLSFE